jgi:putative flippase GtrA
MILLLRHQAGSLTATAVDFGVMVGAVRLLGLGPGTGTAVGAALGGATSFILGRRWVFRAAAGDAPGQALRYTLVCLASVVLNALGERLLVAVGDLQFVVARVVIASVVGITWNFPMQRRFVFRSNPLAEAPS